jgi:hypothetical protein
VIVSNFGSENFGDVARKNARTERSSLNLTSTIRGNDPFLIPSLVSQQSNLTLVGKTFGNPIKGDPFFFTRPTHVLVS